VPPTLIQLSKPCANNTTETPTRTPRPSPHHPSEVGPPSPFQSPDMPSGPPRSWPMARTSHLGQGQHPIRIGGGSSPYHSTPTPTLPYLNAGGNLGRHLKAIKWCSGRVLTMIQQSQKMREPLPMVPGPGSTDNQGTLMQGTPAPLPERVPGGRVGRGAPRPPCGRTGGTGGPAARRTPASRAHRTPAAGRGARGAGRRENGIMGIMGIMGAERGCLGAHWGSFGDGPNA